MMKPTVPLAVVASLDAADGVDEPAAAVVDAEPDDADFELAQPAASATLAQAATTMATVLTGTR